MNIRYVRYRYWLGYINMLMRAIPSTLWCFVRYLTHCHAPSKAVLILNWLLCIDSHHCKFEAIHLWYPHIRDICTCTH